MSSLASKPFKWPHIVRLIHWLVALLFLGNHFVVTAGESYHKFFGWVIFGLIIVRLLYGMTLAPSPARLGDIIPTPSGIKHHLHELKQGVSEADGHNAMGAISVWIMWTGLLLAAFTGWLQDTDFGFEHSVFQWHSWLVDGVLYFVLLHIVAVVLTSWRTGKNLLKTMM